MHSAVSLSLLACLLAAGLDAGAQAAAAGGKGKTVFRIGTPDAAAGEFGLAREGYGSFSRVVTKPVVYTVGRSRPSDWPFVHPADRDSWAGGKAHTFTIRFSAPEDSKRRLYLVVGLCGAHPAESSRVTVSVNGTALPSKPAPLGPAGPVFDPFSAGEPKSLIFAVPAGSIHEGSNTIALRLDGGSWIIYDYVALRSVGRPLKTELPHLERAALGPGAVENIVFAVRKPGPDGHWYANIGYYADSGVKKSYFPVRSQGKQRVTYVPGGKLCILNVGNGKVTTLIDDPKGGVRDPAVHYDGTTILFSWRKGGGEHYHLYQIRSDGTGLRRLTDGDYDDFEPCWLPDGDIVFVSTRCKRWVNCWVTQVATIHRCRPDGSSIHALSANIEHDNTPWVLPDGRVAYQRWEYVDRSQVDYHHLWTMNPDGTAQMTAYGNLYPGTVMIDAKPIPGSEKLVAIFSPGHGRRDHDGAIVVVDLSGGPDDRARARRVNASPRFRDPWAFSENLFLAASGAEILLMNGTGRTRSIYRLPDADARAGYQCHEPRPLAPHPRERIIPPRVQRGERTGRLVLADVTRGRNMKGVQPGEIKKLLVLESLPKPINFTGGMDPLTYGGSFTLERVLGTVPVEPDGSAYMELPALRAFFFVALDENDLAVKRMQSFLTVEPGEVTGCVGCHESRVQSVPPRGQLLALRRPPSRVEPVHDCPDVFDFPRDIQPILDALCVECHGYDTTPRGGPYAGSLILSGDRGPMFSHAYFSMTVHELFSDGRDKAVSNYAPRTLGSSASKILTMLDGSHHDVRATEHQKRMLRLWIETGAPYPGTYGALGCGAIGGYAQNSLVHTDNGWPTTRAGAEVIQRRCAGCHTANRKLPRSLSDELGISFWRFDTRDPRLTMSRHILFNLTRPEKSLILLAPLARAAGGFEQCGNDGRRTPVFADTADPDYLRLLAMVAAGKKDLETIRRFDMPGFRPPEAYVREMKRYGILPRNLPEGAPIDPYKTDRAYWRSLWYEPSSVDQ